MEEVKEIAVGESGDEMAKKIHEHYGTTEALKVPYSEFCKDVPEQVGKEEASRQKGEK